MRWSFCAMKNKGRFCNTIASVALVLTSIQSDKRMQTKEILSSRISKQTKPQSCPETSKASNKQNPRDRTLGLPFFFRCKHITSLKNLPSPAPNESLPYWFRGNFAASFVLKFCLREFLLSAFANRFELRCEPKRLMLLCYKICPCCNRPFRQLKKETGESGLFW